MSVTTRCIPRSHQSDFFREVNQLKICIAVIVRNLFQFSSFLICKNRIIDTHLSILFRSSIFTFSFTYCSRVHRFICNTIIICSRGHYRQLNIHVNFKSLDFFIIFLSPITFCIVYSFFVIE